MLFLNENMITVLELTFETHEILSHHAILLSFGEVREYIKTM